MTSKSLFQKIDFISHAGNILQWKIECDALTLEDWQTLAFMVSQNLTFGSVYGIPRGGLLLEEALRPYITQGPRLVVDDVLTTGLSFKNVYQVGDIGVVVFARGPCPDWVHPLFQCTLA